MKKKCVAMMLIAIMTASLAGDVYKRQVTDYDSGHGGEEAIYYSLAASGAMLLGMIFNVVGSFCKVPQVKKEK